MRPDSSFLLPICLVFLALFPRQYVAQMSKSEESNHLVDDIRLYQKYLSSALGSSCGMYPSCSNYGVASFQQRPIVMGFVKTSDRLMRCGHDLGHYRRVRINNATRSEDLPGVVNYKFNKTGLYYWQDSARKEYGFICHLIDIRCFDEALFEIHRIQYNLLEDGKPESEILALLEVYSYLSMNDPDRAITISTSYLKTRQSSGMLEMLADCHVSRMNYDAASEIYFSLIDSTNFLNRSNIQKKIIYACAAKGNWNAALNELRFLPNNFQKIESVIVRGSLIKPKSIFKAKVLAILPGLGYLYCGQPQTAVTAFLFNGMTAYASYDLFRRRQYGMGVLMTSMSMSFYLGNIYGSGRSAKRYNALRHEKMMEPIHEWAFDSKR